MSNQYKKFKPTMINFSNNLTKSLETLLVGCEVNCKLIDITTVSGEDAKDNFFGMDTIMARVLEDFKHSGDIHLIMDTETAAATTSIMMMLGVENIKNNIKQRVYNEDVIDGFGEIVNQSIGVLNTIFENLNDNVHLWLDIETIKHLDYGESPKTIVQGNHYIVANIGINISTNGITSTQESYWIFNRNIIKNVFDVEINAPPDVYPYKVDGDDIFDDIFLEDDLNTTVLNTNNKNNSIIQTSTNTIENNENNENSNVNKSHDNDDVISNLNKILHTNKNKVGFHYENDKIMNIANTNIINVHYSTTAKEIVDIILKDGHEYVGIYKTNFKFYKLITKYDVRQIIGPFYKTEAFNIKEKSVFSLAIGKFLPEYKRIVINSDEIIHHAYTILTEYDLEFLPIISKSNNRLVGVLSMKNLLNYYKQKNSLKLKSVHL